jgi:hypothetical protein
MAPKLHQFSMPGDSRPDAYSGGHNPNWLGLGNTGSLESGGYGGGNGYSVLSSLGNSNDYLLDNLIAGWAERGIGAKISKNGYLSYWTGGAAGYGNTSQEMVAHMIRLNTNSWISNIGSFFKNHFVFKTELSGSLGVQIGAKLGGPLQANVEAGILSTDIGKIGWSKSDGFYAKYGDGQGHNFVAGGVKLLSKQLSVGGKADYVTKHAIPTAGDLLDYYPNNGHLEWEVNLGPGKSHWWPQKGSDADILNIGLKSKLRGSNKESCAYCADLGIGFKALLGVDIKLIVGFK